MWPAVPLALWTTSRSGLALAWFAPHRSNSLRRTWRQHQARVLVVLQPTFPRVREGGQLQLKVPQLVFQNTENMGQTADIHRDLSYAPCRQKHIAGWLISPYVV